MATFLFDKIIFGPVKSRRLGESLGINLLPVDSKVCNFDCIYCECGLTDSTKGELPGRQEVGKYLEDYLKQASKEGKVIDAITFAGNGEPTLHHDFPGIIEDTCKIRDTYYPNAQIALLTNATTVGSVKLKDTFGKIDQNILKLDSVKQETVEILNCPLGHYDLPKLIEVLKSLHKPIIQTMFVRGSHKGKEIDNTKPEELNPWLDTIRQIEPSLVMIYTIARDTPIDTLEKVSLKQLNEIGDMVKDMGIEVQISG